jgi:hypothetical protein
MEVAMLRRFGWMVAGGLLLGFASLANAQDPQTVGNPALGNAYGYSGLNAYGPVDGGHSVPVIGSHKDCFTLYPLSVVYPYSYTGPGSRFGAYSYVPYPYVPVGYGWYGEHWRGW